MGICRNCDDRGWFLKIDGNGLCPKCRVEVLPDILRRGEIIEQSLAIAQKTKNVATLLSRSSLIVDHCRHLERFHAKGIPTITPPPAEFRRSIEAAIRSAVAEAVDAEIYAARQKAENATTDSGKLGGYGKGIEKLTKLMDEVVDVSDLELGVERLRRERDGLRFDLLGRKAEVAKAKGQSKKAVDLWIEAIMALRHDTTPDSEQADRIRRAEVAIRDLGGEPPAP